MTTKGLVFIALTGGLIYWLTRRGHGLLESRDRFLTNLVNAVNEAVIVIALPERSIVSMNPVAERMFGYDASKIVGRNTEVLHESEESYQKFHELGVTTLERQEPFRTQYPMRRANGDIFMARISVSVFVGPTGERFAVSIVNDMSEEYEREQNLLWREGILRQVTENIRHVFWLSEPDTSELIYVSSAYESIWGRSRDELGQKPTAFMESVHPDDRDKVLRLVERKFSEDLSIEYRIIRPDGSIRWIRDQSFRIHDEAGRVYRCAGFAEDITEWKQQEEALLSAQRREVLGRLSAGVAHDFNNMLMVIMLNLETALDTASDPAQREALDIALRAADRSADLTKRLLAFSGQQTLTPKPTDLNRAIAEARTLLERTLDGRVQIELREADLPVMAELDRGELEHAILNLVINARDAMPAGGKVTLAVGANGEAEAPRVWIAVSDTGEGMTEQVRARALEPFFTTKASGSATGLGLSSIYGFVRQSGGDLTIQSAPGQGTTVTLFFPAADPGEAAPTEEPVFPEEEPGERPGTVLLVDDNPAVRETTQRLVERLGYRTIVAENARYALAILEGHAEIDVLLSDVVMPGDMSGIELAREAKARRPDLPVLLMSGYAEEALHSQNGTEAEIEILSKPLRTNVLRAKLATAVKPASSAAAAS